jgi:spore coat polysaccharide biosynthesis protein SpsF (cytidylyltransferase family)
MNTVAIIQALMGSSRLPGKVLRDASGKPMLAHIINRVSAAHGVDRVVVATSDQPGGQAIRAFCSAREFDCLSGSENDVLDRFYRAAKQFDADRIIRITADCPLVDPMIVGSLIDCFATGDYDHVGVATGAGAIFLDSGRFPDGYDAECMSLSALERAWIEATEQTDREHVTPYLWRQPEEFKLGGLKSAVDYSSSRLTLDNEEDFQLIQKIYQDLYCRDRHFLLNDVVNWPASHSEALTINCKHIGKEGYEALWQPATA